METKNEISILFFNSKRMKPSFWNSFWSSVSCGFEQRKALLLPQESFWNGLSTELRCSSSSGLSCKHWYHPLSQNNLLFCLALVHKLFWWNSQYLFIFLICLQNTVHGTIPLCFCIAVPFEHNSRSTVYLWSIISESLKGIFFFPLPQDDLSIY